MRTRKKPPVKKPTKSKLVKKLDVVYSQYIRRKEADKRGMVKCYTCGKVGHWKNGGMQCGHFMSRKFYSTRWSEDNTKVQCLGCNMYRSGEQYLFARHLDEEYGKGKADELLARSREIRKYSILDIEELIVKYQNLLKKLDVKNA